MRPNSCTDIDLEQNLSGLTTPNEKLIRKRNSDLSPDIIISIKDQNANRSPRLRNINVPTTVSPFDTALQFRSRQGTITEGALHIGSRTLSLSLSHQNPKSRQAFSTPKAKNEYG